MQLTERCDIWRMVGQYDGGKKITAVYTRLPCLRVPISRFDKISTPFTVGGLLSGPSSEHFRPAGRTSTDVFLFPRWVTIRYDDELRRGRRTDNAGNVGPYRYTVDGVLDFEMQGYHDVQYAFASLTQ